MNGLFLYLPEAVGLAEVADLLEATFDVDDQRHLEFPQVVVVGPRNVYVAVVEEWDNGGCWPRAPQEQFGRFVCISFLSSELERITAVITKVIERWPALIDDDRGHVFRADDFAQWAAGHASTSWWDEGEEDALLEMPVLEAYDCDEDNLGENARDQPASSQSSA